MSITQRFFLTNTAAGFTPTTLRGAWDQTAGAVTKLLGRLPSGATTTVGIAEVNATNLWDVLLYRGVSDPLDKAYTFTISDKVQICAGLKESNTSANDFIHVHIYVTQGNTDTPRGTILTDSIGATEFTTTAGFRSEGLKTLSALACSAGDRIVVEIGYQAQNTVTTSFTGTLNYGGTSNSGVAAATNVTVNVGWVEFTTSDHFFNTSPVTWSPSSTTVNAVLSDNNLLTTVTNAGSNLTGSTRPTFGHGDGKYVLALRIKAVDSFGPQFGLATSPLPTTVSPGDYSAVAIPNAEGAAMQFGSALVSAIYATTTQIFSQFFTAGVGDTVFIAFDISNRKWYARVNSDPWFGGSGTGAVPDSGTGAYDLSSTIAANKFWFPAIGYDTGSGAGAKNSVELDASAYGHGLTTFSPWDIISASLTATLNDCTLSATATVTGGGGVVTETGTLAVTLDAATLSATATVKATGALAATLDPVTIVSNASAKASGSLSATLDPATISSAAQAKATAALNIVLDALTISATAKAAAKGALNVTLDNVTASISASARATASLGITLDALTLSASTKVKTTASLAVTLADATLSAVTQTKISDFVGATLDNATLAANAVVRATANLGVTLDGVLLDAQVRTQSIVSIASLNAALDDAVMAGSAVAKASASLAIVLADCTLIAAGNAVVSGSLAITLDDVTTLLAARFSETPRYIFEATGRSYDHAGHLVYSFKALPRVRSFTAKARSYIFRAKPRED